jgi:hypothetical protein
MTRLFPVALFLLLGACAAQVERPSPPSGDGQTRPQARPAAAPAAPAQTDSPLPAGGGASAEALDTTTEEERQAAVAGGAAGGGASLGTTVASLGNPAEGGFWLKTPLVQAEAPGRVVFAGTGQAVEVELRPSETEPGGGSQISLAAMRALGAPLTGLPEVEVFRR